MLEQNIISLNKKVVVFGGSGFLGSYVSDELTRKGYNVVIADINPSPYIQTSQKFENKYNEYRQHKINY